MTAGGTPFEEDGDRQVPSSAATLAIAATTTICLTALMVLLARGGSFFLSMPGTSVNVTVNPPT